MEDWLECQISPLVKYPQNQTKHITSVSSLLCPRHEYLRLLIRVTLYKFKYLKGNSCQSEKLQCLLTAKLFHPKRLDI